jgi:hypothetical protein
MSLESTKSTKVSDRAAGSAETIDFNPGEPFVPRPTSVHAETISTQDSVGDAGSHGPELARPRPASAGAAIMSTRFSLDDEERDTGPHSGSCNSIEVLTASASRPRGRNSANVASPPPGDYGRLLQKLKESYLEKTMPPNADAQQRRLHFKSSLGSFTRTNTCRTHGPTIHSHVEGDQQDAASRILQAYQFDNQLNIFNPSLLPPDPPQDPASLAAPPWYKSRSGTQDDPPMYTSGSASRPTYRRCDPPPRVALHSSSGLPWTDETVSDMWSAMGGTHSGSKLGRRVATFNSTPQSERRGQGLFEVGTEREKLSAQIPSSVYSVVQGPMIDRGRPVSRRSDVSRSFFGT